MRTFLNLILAMGADDMEDGTMMKRSIKNSGAASMRQSA